MPPRPDSMCAPLRRLSRLAFGLAALVLAAQPLCARGQLIVYDHTRTALSVSDGFTDPLKQAAVWVFDTGSLRVVKIRLWPELMEYSVSDDEEAILHLVGAGGQHHFVIGDSYDAPSSESIPQHTTSFSMLRGRAGPPGPDGRYPVGSWPKRLAGPSFFSMGDPAMPGTAWLVHGSQSLVLNGKLTQYHNAKGHSVDAAVAEILKFYGQRGYNSDR